MRPRALAAGAAMALLVGAAPACAERLVISLSTHRVQITSNFTGLELTLFGAVENDAAAIPRVGAYSIVATVTGPRETVVTWRKERVFGIWINRAARTFVEPPSYLAVLSTRPVDTIAPVEVLRRNRVGLRHIVLPQKIEADIGEVAPDDPFRRAFVRVKMNEGLYREQNNAITMLTPSLFRASIPLPANVPTGDYEVDVKLFAEGALIARETTAFEIIKAGFEQFVAHASRDYGLLYGLATAALALLTGWLGSIVFRRD